MDRAYREDRHPSGPLKSQVPQNDPQVPWQAQEPQDTQEAQGYKGGHGGEPHTGGPSSDRTEVPGERYTIGEVVSALREDFPSLSVSKVRYLERRRLVEPERTSGGYRLFGRKDVELLKKILTLQENDYLPLEVIKDRIDSGIIQYELSGDGSAEREEAEQFGALGGEEDTRTYSREELCREAGADSRFIEELVSVGVIGRGAGSYGGSGSPGGFDYRDLEISRLAVEMSKYSIQPRHLRGIVASVDREVAMFKQVLSPELRSGDEKRVSEALESARHLAAVDSRLKDFIMAGAIGSLDPSQNSKNSKGSASTTNPGSSGNPRSSGNGR